MSEIYKKLGYRLKKIREASGISQERLALILKLSRPTVSQIETGERKLTADEVIKISEIFNISVNSLLDLEKEIEVILPDAVREVKKETPMRINVPQKNLEKFKEVFMYILDRVGSKPNVGETVIYKLLYFMDFDFYERYEEQLVGACYIKNHYGPTPVEFKKIADRMMLERDIERVESNYFSYPQTKYLPVRKPDLSKFTANEIGVIDDVLNRLGEMNAGQISDYSHNDVPWLTTNDGEIIDYESVFYRSAHYSAKKYK
ncbi:MAG: DUF4065 domain-containing protein [Candidatus Sericytochromatia bacterium]|nr:DUF4065 domain-containing protein [Candidatus Sericytochromatia bacterium]